jgi:N-acetylglucosamine kinase-like BadF-type ATPase
MVIISGTGSVAYARNRSGDVRRVGGLGAQLGDEGSGYALGRAALGAAGKAADGRGPATILLEKIHRATDTTDLDSLIRWTQSANREQVAALARAACDAAVEGDPIARELVEHSAHELAHHAVALWRRLSPETPKGVALAGGLLASDSPVRIRLVAALSRIAPELTITDSPIDPALGAASLATRL